MIVEGVQVGDRVFDILKKPNFPVGVVLQILKKEATGGPATGSLSFDIVVLFDGSEKLETYPITDFGKNLIFVSKFSHCIN